MHVYLGNSPYYILYTIVLTCFSPASESRMVFSVSGDSPSNLTISVCNEAIKESAFPPQYRHLAWRSSIRLLSLSNLLDETPVKGEDCVCVCVCVCVFEGIQKVSFVWEKLCQLFALLAQTECSLKLIFKRLASDVLIL